MRFSEIIGQSENVRHLKRAIEKGKVSHAYMLCGEEGSGRMPLAMAFAAALLCEEGGAEACGHCPSCRRIAEGMHPDLHRVAHEKPNTISVEDIRTQVIHDVGNRPYGSYKVYIIDEAEKMNESAQNALLKTIEEPPPYAVLILLSTHAAALLPTIRSRCVELVMRPVADAEIINYLMEQVSVPDYRARSIASFAQNNLGRAVRLATSSEFEAQKDQISAIMRQVWNSTYSQRLAWQKELAQEKDLLPQKLSLMQVWLRDLMLIKSQDGTAAQIAAGLRKLQSDAAGGQNSAQTTDPASRIAFVSDRTALSEIAKDVSWQHIKDALDALEEARARWTANVRPELVCGLLLERMAGEKPAL